jgi:hypothetical protein
LKKLPAEPAVFPADIPFIGDSLSNHGKNSYFRVKHNILAYAVYDIVFRLGQI